MSDVARSSRRRYPTRLFVAGALLSGLLVSCARVEPVEVSAGALPPAAPPPAPASSPTTKFQGSVASVDPAAGAVVVKVTIVWTPVVKAEAGERRVVVDPGTRWEPRSLGLTDLRVGEEIQVEAGDAVDGNWPALRVQLFDID